MGTNIPASTSGGSAGLADVWARTAANAMAALVPALTRFEYLKLPAGAVTSPGVAVNVVGGAVGVASDTVVQVFGIPTIWTAPRTDPIGAAFRVKFPAITTGHASSVVVALANGSGAIITLGWSQPTSATKWVLFTGSDTQISPFAADALEHTIIVTADGVATVTGVVDGVTVATSSALAAVTNSPCQPGSFSSVAITPGVIVSRIVYGYADPT